MRSDEVLSAPLTVNWSLSYRCNFDCSHCYSREAVESGLSIDEVIRTARLLADRGVVYVNFGGGEPLLYPRLFEVASACAGLGLRVTMNSNGFLLGPPEAEKIASAGFASVGISIDSPDPEVHDRFRNRPGSYGRAVAALDHLAAAGVPRTVSTVVHRGNLHTWRRMIDLCRSRGARTLYLHNYKCAGMGKVNMDQLDLAPAQWREFYVEAIEVRNGIRDVSISFDDPIMACLPGHVQEAAVPGSTCGKLSLHIRPDGGITPCGFIPVTIGNILTDDFDEVWFDSPVLARLRSKEPQGKCRSCSSYAACLGGCSARVFALTGTFEAPDPHCWVSEADDEA